MAQDNANWRKSSLSGDGGTGGGDCVEAAQFGNGYALRDSKNPDARISLSVAGMTALLRSITSER
ncbi:DUF397 domain-containing protein [Actinokineospora sp. NBRC 105648]|uniref:DUF397 domain-containing protein n=1 Tax=Actinokineospora sp. NBRC 105648 TaxID=3032206 RepID=UPI0024A49D20|nr:DUF397 domain-containing protein [Actinokineospora sp. NBRC 105648]GLZ40364.1 hypothetical protein Acsp05_39880 [Actinokineospora sp. NBRC 105648]